MLSMSTLVEGIVDAEDRVAFTEELFSTFKNLSIKDVQAMAGVTNINDLNISFKTSHERGAGITVTMMKPSSNITEGNVRNDVIELRASYNSKEDTRSVQITFQNQGRFFRLHYAPRIKEDQKILHLSNITIASLPGEMSHFDANALDEKIAKREDNLRNFDLGNYRLGISIPQDFKFDPNYLSFMRIGFKTTKEMPKHPFSFSKYDGDHVTFSGRNNDKFCKTSFSINLPTHVILNPSKLVEAVPKLNGFKSKV